MPHTRRMPWRAAICPIVVAMVLICSIGVQAAGGRPAAAPEAAAPSAPADHEAIPTRDLWRIIRDAGPLMIPIVACSFLLVTFVLERLISLRRSRVIPKPFVTRFLEQLADGEIDRPQALALCEENGSPVAQVFAGAVRKWGRPAVEVEQAVIDQRRAGDQLPAPLPPRVLRHHHRRPVARLDGDGAGNDPDVQRDCRAATPWAAPSCWPAASPRRCLNTAGGLAVAIPASILYVFFISRVDRLIIGDRRAGPGRGQYDLRGGIAGTVGPRSAKAATAPRRCESTMPLKTHVDEQPSLNLTAMLDVMFLLIIFFMLGTRFVDDERQIGLRVPEVVDRGQLAAAAERKSVNVYRDGAITLDQKPVTWPS